MQLKPSKLTKEQVFKVLKVALWVMASGALSALLTWVDGNKDMFGIYYPLVNVFLVFVKQIFTQPEE